ncbi:hypothetical protein C2869_12560 [Saccharobesus litoralis]|uniref:Transglutaminase-like domain-containing protein n=1 Tax=Saccharobesus litoralis TaxID=2172099 RepID=A0A2S0VSP0_9ALTE|nr:DUF3488 and transglutaminase-like domain-containing protein [Saccharobesus litoralis]AWB67217.1 hypothetical protein C2869_12560 [Saccharobesus litoralis]
MTVVVRNTQTNLSRAQLYKMLGFMFVSQSILLTYQAVQHVNWVIFFYILCAIWRFTEIQKLVPPITKTLKSSCFVVGIILVGATAIEHTILTALFVMLCVAISLKLLEFNTSRDLFGILVIQLFLTASTVLFFFDLHHVLLLTLSLFLILACLVQFKLPNLALADSLKRSGQLALFSLPMALFLFFMMPQLPPLWKMAKPKAAPTGLSEDVKPGDIADLAGSNKLAFRVEFQSTAPKNDQLYWRTIVHEEFDGESWKMSPVMRRWLKQPKHRRYRTPVDVYQFNNTNWQYNVILEASYQPWMPALSLASSQDSQVALSPNLTLVNEQIFSKATQYKVVSYQQLLSEPQLNYARWQNLQLPAQGNERTREWARQERQKFANDLDFISHILNLFNQQNFRYTLKPPRYGVDGIDKFLFDGRAGFCAHYASAFSFIMRSVGIPARVVSGYQGGEWNPKGQYYSLYQYDAHAWSEVYLGDLGWKRFDPTAFVAPERVELNLQQAMRGQDSFLADSQFALVKYKDLPLVNDMRHWLANVDYQWTRWIINYNRKKQENLFKLLFGQQQNWHFYLKLVLFLLAGVAVFVFLIVYIQRIKRSPSQSIKYYQLALSRLAKYQIHKQPGDTPQRLTPQVALVAPQLLPHWQLICQLLDDIQYRSLTPKQYKQKLKQLKKCIALIK